jgi:hypothetical protein
VAALAFLPAWFRPLEGEALEPAFGVETERYTVTGNPSMARQVVVRAAPTAGTPGSLVRVRFVGFHPFVLAFRVPAR